MRARCKQPTPIFWGILYMIAVIGTALYLFSFLNYDDDEDEHNNRILTVIYCIGNTIMAIIYSISYSKFHGITLACCSEGISTMYIHDPWRSYRSGM